MTSPHLMELLLCCARTQMEAGHEARARALCEGDLDWAGLIQQARRHGLDPLLYRHLVAIGAPPVPAGALEQLRARAEITAVRNRLLLAELAKVMTALDGEDIRAIPYKGPVLAASLYGDLGLRRFADLDILVRHEDVRRSVATLRGLGYEPRFDLTRAQERAYLASRCEYALDRNRGRLTVEVHWDIVPRDFAFRFDLEHLWRDARRVAIDGITVLAPRPEDLFVMLVVHGSKHLWERLAWLCDVSEMIGAHPGMDWARVQSWAREGGGVRMLHLAVTLAHRLLGTAIPPGLAEGTQTDASMAALAARITDWLLRSAPPSPRSMPALRAHLAMRERRRDRLSSLLRVALTPTIEDWAALPLPAALLPAHYLLRPFRLAGKHAAALFRRPP